MPMDVYAAVGALVRAEMCRAHAPQPEPPALADAPVDRAASPRTEDAPAHQFRHLPARPWAYLLRRLTAILR
ncbi:hypothetical protein [Streptomyces sp. NBC_01320]|uniref:hypothetical protein n=1 Tax=Streptomyces sp. NBC_01320 TaxID=2903824 RepID=UPI002E144565|nr:hypothetical protein OG395_51365 [Streptomyces sp. NBC_01320]